ncbi:MAG: PHP domain-containing protein [Clostridiales bacterium]|jgi:PHP family Zn ribbon phosphoesterase|nr:PHP domain-containing protein [Clostridiales bacterium]
MTKLSYDLHIHSCLSPCGNEDMSPANIVNMAKLIGLDVIAVTDHNSCKNLPAVYSHAKKSNIIAIFGMELCTMEEVHVLCYFKRLEDALAFDKYVYDNLIKVTNKKNIFGKQEIYNDEDIKVGEEPNLLINATNISFNSLDELMDRYKGVYVPAHVDKGSNSLLSNLGFVPPDVEFSCVEINDMRKADELCRAHSYFTKCNIITNSDAHSLEDINDAINFINVRERSSEAVFEAITLRNK